MGTREPLKKETTQEKDGAKQKGAREFDNIWFDRWKTESAGNQGGGPRNKKVSG